MFYFFLRRLLYVIPVIIVISIIGFTIIQLPPGSFLDTILAQMEAQGYEVTDTQVKQLERTYGLNKPAHVQYFKWVSGIILRGDFGTSLEWNEPVIKLLKERIPLTLVVSVSALLFSWVIAFPVGIYSAVKQHTIGDYAATFIGFIGLSVPNFMLALILMFISYNYFGASVGGLFSPEYKEAAWSLAKLLDMLKHLWIPAAVIGTAGTAGLIRIMRNNMLDELKKPYVEAARIRGLKEIYVLIRYPIRLALIPFISTAGWQLPKMLSGAAIVSVVLNLPTTGPLLLKAFKSQDMYLAASFTMILAILTIIGTFISDILLALTDPRIRYE